MVDENRNIFSEENEESGKNYEKLYKVAKVRCTPTFLLEIDLIIRVEVAFNIKFR